MTKSKLTSMAAASMMMAATTFAQTPSGASSTPAAAGAADRITITGCVERADQMNAGSGSSAGASVDSQEFVLVKAEAIAPAGSSASAASAGSTAAARTSPSPVGTSGSASAPIYRLNAAADKLNPHVGHKVEVVGTREAQTPNAATNAADPANPSTATAPRLMVESVKMISDSCAR